MNKPETVLISGAGIAGPTLAYWLARYGFSPTLIERAPALRTGGYILDFWGAGFDVAERKQLIPHVRRPAYAPPNTADARTTLCRTDLRGSAKRRRAFTVTDSAVLAGRALSP